MQLTSVEVKVLLDPVGEDGRLDSDYDLSGLASLDRAFWAKKQS